MSGQIKGQVMELYSSLYSTDYKENPAIVLPQGSLHTSDNKAGYRTSKMVAWVTLVFKLQHSVQSFV